MRRILLLALLVSFASFPAVGNAATALLLGGVGQYAELTDEQMSTAMGGYFADYTRINVAYPGLPDDFGYSLRVGTDNLYAAVYATDGPKTIGGVSESGPVVIEVLRRLMNDENRPPPNELDAVVLGPLSPALYRFTGVTYREPPETPYDLKVVKAEYDGVADWPDNWLNALAVINAVMGAGSLHVASAFYDITLVPPEYITTTTNSLGGTTTTYLIPTPVLPILQPLVDSGASPQTVEFLDAVLRPVIDTAYQRFWTRPPTAMSAAPATPAIPSLAPADNEQPTTTVESTEAVSDSALPQSQVAASPSDSAVGDPTQPEGDDTATDGIGEIYNGIDEFDDGELAGGGDAHGAEVSDEPALMSEDSRTELTAESSPEPNDDGQPGPSALDSADAAAVVSSSDDDPRADAAHSPVSGAGEDSAASDGADNE